jgi:hypothetical protein
VAHPFLSLFQLLTGAYLDRRFADHDAAAARIRDEYLAGWGAWAGSAELARALRVPHPFGAFRSQPTRKVAWSRASDFTRGSFCCTPASPLS